MPEIELLPITDPQARTESSNARRFCQLHAGRVRYAPAWGRWLVWNGQRWNNDDGCDVPALAKEVEAQVWAEVAAALPTATARESLDLLSFARATASAKGMANLLTLAQSEPGIPLDHEKLDADPWLLNLENGTLDLRTQQIRPHNREDLITKVAPVVFQPEADCPRWILFLHEIFDDDAELIAFVRRFAGYCLTGNVGEHVMPIFHGGGRNGKSVLIGTLLALLGPYGMTADANLILATKYEQHPTGLKDLFGKRLVACVEANAGRHLNEALVKHLTGGDRIRARGVHENFWEFSPSHKPALLTNHLPTVRGTDDGIWSRLPLVPFKVSFLGREDRSLAETLKGELSGILNWALLGLAEWLDAGLGIPAAVSAATAGYRSEQDHLGSFLAERCTIDPEAWELAGDLYRAFTGWCDAEGEKPLSSNLFGRLLTERGFGRQTLPGGRKARTGVRINHE